jgi:phosphoribosyl-ATP pyrophosphohydrolase/phosphoribosyl-AMP cyclohydrolase/histidinol dehydrogenase
LESTCLLGHLRFSYVQACSLFFEVSLLPRIALAYPPCETVFPCPQVIADSRSNPTFVASDLLSQAEHGVDSQVVLLTIDVTPSQLAAIEEAVDTQARALPRCEIARKAIEKSIIVQVKTREEAMAFSNDYAPEHLIMQVDKAEDLVKDVVNAGSVFVGDYSPES